MVRNLCDAIEEIPKPKVLCRVVLERALLVVAVCGSRLTLRPATTVGSSAECEVCVCARVCMLSVW